MSGATAEVAGLLGATALAATALVSPPGRRRSLAMLGAALLAPAFVLGDQWDSPLVRDLRARPETLLAVTGGIALAIAALAALFLRRPLLLPLVAVAVLPFRVPIEAGGDQANLLLPLYIVIAAGVAVAVLRVRGPVSTAGEPGAAIWLRRLLAATIVLYALQALYSEDLSRALQQAGFFLVPFALLFTLLFEVRWDRRLLRLALFVVLAEALLFAAVGLVEYGLRELLWNEQIIRSNEFRVSAYFRVNSLFWDPNILGRYLALAILLAVAALAWTRSRSRAVRLAAVIALLWPALLVTFSQSSFVALLVGLAALAALRWSLRWTAAAAGVAALGALALAVATGAFSSERAINKDTSGRANLVSGGIDLFAERPLAGWGSGAFVEAYRAEQERESEGAAVVVAASHTEPVTVGAEQGAVGLALYLALLVAAFATLLAGARRWAPGFGGAEGAPAAPARAALVAAFAALLVHTMIYAAFLPDPITWTLLAVAAHLRGST